MTPSPLSTSLLTPPRPCPYLPGRMEQSLLSVLGRPWAQKAYERALAQGFRRFQDMMYRPSCPGCHACVPLRLPVGAFHPSRSQKRILRACRDLHEDRGCPVADHAHFDLFQRYQQARHRGGGMDEISYAGFSALMLDSPICTESLRFRDTQGRLVACMLIDWLSDGASAVYSFFDPDRSRHSLGSFMILRAIALCQAMEKPHLYLGYWIDGSPKMAYKTAFKPAEILVDGAWKRLEAPQAKTGSPLSETV